MGFFSKKDKERKDEQDAAARSQLFGSRGGKEAPPAAQNPYTAPPPPYQSQPQQPSQGAYGGYGAESTSTIDRNRDALFSGRQPQQQQQQQQRPPPGGSYGSDSSGGYGRPDGYSQPAGGSSYGQSGYGQDRVLTAEEEEEEDVEAVKQQIRFTKQESVSSTRNALRIAGQAEETGRNTLARLGTQGERLYNTEKNLDVATAHNRVAEEKARELKTLNGSMFAVHMKNPMKSKSRAEAEERKILDRHQSEREERERTRQFGYEGKDAVGKALNDTAQRPGFGRTKMSMAEKNKYQFEADESDEEKEKEIYNNLDQLSGVTARLKGLAMATGQEVDRQNKQINKIMQKVGFIMSCQEVAQLVVLSAGSCCDFFVISMVLKRNCG